MFLQIKPQGKCSTAQKYCKSLEQRVQLCISPNRFSSVELFPFNVCANKVIEFGEKIDAGTAKDMINIQLVLTESSVPRATFFFNNLFFIYISLVVLLLNYLHLFLPFLCVLCSRQPLSYVLYASLRLSFTSVVASQMGNTSGMVSLLLYNMHAIKFTCPKQMCHSGF